MADSSTPLTLSAAQVKRWLAENPDFFEHHPELLDSLVIPHGAGTVSLIERQVERLRSENRRLHLRLRQLSGIAGENERLMQRLHHLTLELGDCPGFEELIGRLTRRLAEDFQADRVRLALGPDTEVPAKMEAVTRLPEKPPKWLERMLAGGQPECGRLTRGKIRLLFGEPDAESIGSAALAPVTGHGVLAIGAESPERFYPDMGTLFLELLGRTVGYRLDRLSHRGRKRA